MKLNYIAFTLLLTSAFSLQASDRNLCDDLVDSGTASAEQIKKCLDDPRFGPSEHYRDQKRKRELKIREDNKEATDNQKDKENYEIKKFTSDELYNEGFGKPFYAIKGDYRNHRYKEERITEGDALCTFLGYEKALKSVVSPEIWENKNGNIKVDKQGLVIDTSIFGNPSETPELYRDEDYKFTVRKYVEITCVRRKDKKLEISKEALKAVTEDLVMLNEELNSGTSGSADPSVNNGSRSNSSKETKTPNGYNPPDWAKNAGAISK